MGIPYSKILAPPLLGELHHGDHVADAGAGVQDDGLLGHGHGGFLVHGGQLGRGSRAEAGARDGLRTAVVPWNLDFHEQLGAGSDIQRNRRGGELIDVV